jgi:hypothetical protein
MFQIFWYIIICLSIWFLYKKPPVPPKQEDQFYSRCLISAYEQLGRAANFESLAYMPTGFRVPVIFPPHTIMWLMEVREVDGETWLKVCKENGYGIGWIRRRNL